METYLLNTEFWRAPLLFLSSKPSMTLSEEDLYKLSYSPRIFSLLRRLNVKELLDVVKQWFDHDELKPLRRSATWEEYESIKSQKQKVLDQIVLDWPNGLYMVQAAQLDLKCMSIRNTCVYWLTLTRRSRCYESSDW